MNKNADAGKPPPLPPEDVKDVAAPSCAIVGARGYAGLELARLLLRHPKARLENCFATSKFRLAEMLAAPAAANVSCRLDSEIMDHRADVVFLATPAEVSLELAPRLLAAGSKVIDLSGAFRLKKHDYATWYGFAHSHLPLLQQADYGLSPWTPPTSAALIANPGCYATAISLALIPLVKNDLIRREGVVVDAKSGTSGAGKKAAENLLFTEVDGECLPYKVGRHQHFPEIVEAVERVTGQVLDFHFTTSLLPVRRGIIAGIYADLRDGVDLDDVAAAFESAYGHDPLIRHGHAQSASALMSLKKVVGTARTHFAYEVVGRKLYLFSCIDNLLKGAAGQAVENFNRISDLPAMTGLDHLEGLI